MENKGYILIQDWMLDLPLSLAETMAYAVIYGFSQDGESSYKGSLAYLARKCKVSKDTVRRALTALVDGKFVQRMEHKVNGVTFYEYCTMLPPIANCNHPPCKLLPNNKDINKDNNISISKGGFQFFQSLLEIGVTPQTAKDWMAVRKEKRAANTETAFRRIQQEISKAGLTAEECIRMSAEHSWQGFKAEWVQKQTRAAPAQKVVSAYEHNRRLMEELMGAGFNETGGMIDEQ